MDDQTRDLLFRLVDGIIDDEEFSRLQDLLENDEQVRREYLQILGLSESLVEIAGFEERPSKTVEMLGDEATRPSVHRRNYAPQLALVATLLILVGGAAFWVGRQFVDREGNDLAEQREESLIAGHAILRRAVGLKWSDVAATHREGDVLSEGLVDFSGGIAEIDFFCGATLIVEGPARLEIESDWSVRVLEGRLRASVPPAARGFVVKAADSEIIDLGTEFALEVGAENAHVEVIDGEVKLNGGKFDGKHLLTGQGQSLLGAEQLRSFAGLSTGSDLQERRAAAEAKRFAAWKQHSATLRNDKRLIAYYPMAEMQVQREVPNAASTGGDRDGLLIGPVNRTFGRFGPSSLGLEFDRPGARVRTRIDGEFQAFTFACWVRIDRLEHRYNALFMGDGYENGEPHWQIREDGCLMFSVMVDDSQDIRHFNEIDQRVVQGAGLHRVYYTKPIWDISKSGQWFHLVAVYDPVGRRVKQYVNGVEVSSQEIVDKFHVTKLRIGPAEIGNWGQPFRKTPWFAVRHLNGTIDELALFNAVLSAEEITKLHAEGKPLGY